MKSLKVTIYSHVILMIFAINILVTIVSFLVASSEIDEFLENESLQIADRVSQSLAFPFWNLDSTGVSEILDAQMKNTNTKAIILHESTSSNQFSPGLLKLRNGEIREIGLNDEIELKFHTREEIYFEDEKLGEVTVVLTDFFLRKLLIQNELRDTFFELLFLLLLSVPISIMISKKILNPVKRISNNFNEVVQSHFEQTVAPVEERELQGINTIFENVRLTLIETFEDIQKNEKNLTTTLNSISDGIITLNDELIIQRINPGAELFFSYELHLNNSVSISDIIKFKNNDDDFFSLLETNTFWSTRSTIITADENEMIVDITGSPVLDSENRKIGLVITIRDKTDELKIEEELKQRRKMESLGQLSGGVAHDFNNMLGGIIGFSELLSDSLDDDSEEFSYVQNILSAATSAADLTAKLLAFSRKGKMVSTPFSIHKSCESSLSLLKRTIDKTINISSNLKANEHFVTGDPSQIQNAILNLCINAKDAMGEGGSLTITSENRTLDDDNVYSLPAGNYITIDITDTGSGIPEEIQSKIFEPFFTTKEVGKGTGLGLAAVYGAVQNHNGTISVQSQIGKGTTFTLLFPVVTTSASFVEERHHENNIKEFNKRVLVVDDEKIIRVMLDKIISDMGGEVTQAADGVEAVALFREKHEAIDLVILDMVMPNMNGDQCFKELQEIDNSVPIIVSSGFDKNSSITMLLENGAKGYLHKPFNIHELTEKLVQFSKK